MKKKPPQKIMLLVKFFIDLFPDEMKSIVRKNLWLRALYSKNLQKSGLLHGFPSPAKLQKNYLKNIQQQNKLICELSADITAQRQMNLLVVLAGEIEIDLQSVSNIQSMQEVKTIFLAGKAKDIDILFSVLENQHKIKPILGETIEEQTTQLPLLLLRSGDHLHADAIKVFNNALQKSALNELILYSDKDTLDPQIGRHKAQFMPDWNPDLQLSCAYVNTGVVVAGARALRAFWQFAQKNDPQSLIPRWFAHIYLDDINIEVKHIPLTLVHQSLEYALDWQKALEQCNKSRFELQESSNRDVAKLQWNKQKLPLVSLIIPTKNAKLLVQTCIESILSKTNYANFEILLIDNNSDDPEALTYFTSLQSNPRITVLCYPYSFNYSAINNFAVEHAKGEVIGLINNDIEVVSPDWLSMMVGHSMRHDIGCVGAKLLYPDNRIQHAGVVMGYGGGAGHAHKYYPSDHPGYQNRLIASHNFSAVTAACLLVKKSDYLAVNGLNEKDLTVAFNDIDFCLRVLQLGRRNLYCAEAVLYHHESVSRGLDDTHAKMARFDKELAYLQTRWKQYIDHDPAYNPNLTLRRENFSIKE